MSDSYTKLFSSIVASTIVDEPVATRWLWVTFLSQAGKDGCVYGSAPGMARLANISRSEFDAGLACFLAPDPDSRSQEHDGRRVEEIDGGWRLVNHAKYAAIRSAEERLEYKRKWDRENRKPRNEPDKSDNNPTNPTEPDESDRTDPTSSSSSSIPSSSTKDQDQKISSDASASDHPPKDQNYSPGFESWWKAYPKIRWEAKKKAYTYWVRDKLEDNAAWMLRDMTRRAADHGKWLEDDGKFIPMPTTFLNQARYRDEIKASEEGETAAEYGARLAREREARLRVIDGQSGVQA